MSLIQDLKPAQVIALHAPLGCIDDASQSPLAQRLAKRTGMPLVPDVGYPTPGSFGSWGADRGLPVITYEFPLATTEILMRDHVPVLVELLTQTG
jgi:protein MpaA